MIAADANDPRGIVWIASYPKSGNTWLRIFLHHLIRIKSGRPLGDREIDRVGVTSPSITGRAELYAQFMGKPLVSAEMPDIIRARPKVQEAMVREAPALLLVKTHSILGRVFDVPLINLGVSVGGVYIVRNPLDVAVSMASYLSKTIDATIHSMAATLNASPTTERHAGEIWGSWTENVASWTTEQTPVIKVVRYEDLLDDPIGNFTAIVEHLRFGASPGEIAEAVSHASFAELAREEDVGGFAERAPTVDRFFRVGQAGQWRERLTPEQVDTIVASHGEQMRRFGYLPAQLQASE